MTTEFWLIRGGTRLRFPVNPESNSYTAPFTYTDTEVEELGEVTTIGRRGLREFTISTFWPRDYNPVYCSYPTFISPHNFLYQVEKWRDEQKPIQYIVTGASAVNRYVTIRDLRIESERAGSPGDIYFTMLLKEYREPKVNRLDTSKPASVNATVMAERPAATTPEKVKSYTIKKNDSLWKIAKLPEVYGDGDKWRRIYDANTAIIGKNPNNIQVGQTLVIPQ